jgi:hypothetical protein
MKKKAKPGTSLKYRLSKTKLICEAYENGNVTIESCCGEYGISVRTFTQWCGLHSEISERYKKAKEQHNKIGKESIREKSIDGLTRLITGYWVDETETMEIYGKTGQLNGKRVMKKRRYVGPNPTAVIFALKNTDPANWGDQINVDVSGEKQVFKIGDQIIEFN